MTFDKDVVRQSLRRTRDLKTIPRQANAPEIDVLNDVRKDQRESSGGARGHGAATVNPCAIRHLLQRRDDLPICRERRNPRVSAVTEPGGEDDSIAWQPGNRKQFVHPAVPQQLHIDLPRPAVAGQDPPLYREASLTIQACAQNHAPAKLTDRSRAICCGLLARLGKYMLAVDTLVTHQDSCADVLIAINRCMFESAVNVTYLLHVDRPEVYEDFVKKGLVPWIRDF
jgi:hypothetical protein